MPIVSRAHRFLFLMAPRTGCTALGERVLIPRFGGEYVPSEDCSTSGGRVIARRKHGTLDEILRVALLSRHEVRQLLVFTTVRNPFDSLVSWYFKLRTVRVREATDPGSWIHREPGHARIIEAACALDFSDWVIDRYTRLATWRHPVARVRRRLLRPHHMYGPYLRGADVVMRYEALERDLGRVLERLGLPVVAIPVRNRTHGRDRDYRPYYTERARRVVEYVFRPDLRCFGYRF
jgi:hypothetical protein